MFSARAACRTVKHDASAVVRHELTSRSRQSKSLPRREDKVVTGAVEGKEDEECKPLSWERGVATRRV